MPHPLLLKNPEFRRIARGFHAPILLATLLMVVASVLALGVPLALKRIVESQADHGNPGLWIVLGVALLLSALALRAYGSLRATAVSEQLKAALRLKLYEILLARRMAFHREHGPGTLMSALYSDLEQLASVYTNLVPSGISSAVLLAGSSVALAVQDLRLAITLLSASALVFLLMKLAFRRIRHTGKALQEQYSRVYKAVNETLQQILVIKTHNLGNWAQQRLAQNQQLIVELNVRLRFYHGLMSIAVQVLLAAALMAGWLFLSHKGAPDSLGTQVSTLLFGLLLVRQVGVATNLLGQFRQAQGAMDRLFELLEHASAQTEPGGQPGAKELPDLRQIEFRSMDFCYGERKVLEQVSAVLVAGQRVALVGANGAGKTTLLSLLAGLEQIPAGAVFWNDVDLSTVAVADLRKRVAYLPQDSLLSQATIAENLRMGDLQASDEALWQAAEQAGVADSIRQQEHGMDTLLGSEGSRFSGGEKRRLALARLLIRRDADLYLLDEPTEGLDPESEQNILSTALKTLKGKTVILITHRPVVLGMVDRVWRLDGGNLREEMGQG